MKSRYRLLRAIVIPVVLVTALLYLTLGLYLQDRIDRRHDAGRSLLQVEYEALVRDINGSLNHVLAIAEFPSVQRYLADAQQAQPSYQTESLERAQDQLGALFDTLLIHFGAYARLVLIDRDGQELLSAGLPYRSERKHADAPYFHQAMALPPRGVYVSPPYVGRSLFVPETRITVMDIAVPMYSQRGQRLGVLVLTLDWQGLMANLPHKIKADNTARFFLVDAQGVSLMPGVSASTSFGRSLAGQWPEVWEALSGRHRGEVILGDQAVLFRTHDIRSHHYRSQAEKVVSEAQSQPWHLGVQVTRPDLSQLVAESSWQLIVTGLVYLMAIGFSLLWMFSNQRQRALRRQAEALSMEAKT